MDSTNPNSNQKLGKSFENVIVQKIGLNKTIPILPKPPLLDEPNFTATIKTINVSDINKAPNLKCSSIDLSHQSHQTNISLEKTNSAVSIEQNKSQPLSTQDMMAKNSTKLINSSLPNQNLIKIFPKLPVKSLQRTPTGNLLLQGPNNKILSLQIKQPGLIPTTLTTKSASAPTIAATSMSASISVKPVNSSNTNNLNNFQISQTSATKPSTLMQFSSTTSATNSAPNMSHLNSVEVVSTDENLYPETATISTMTTYNNSWNSPSIASTSNNNFQETNLNSQISNSPTNQPQISYNTPTVRITEKVVVNSNLSQQIQFCSSSQNRNIITNQSKKKLVQNPANCSSLTHNPTNANNLISNSSFSGVQSSSEKSLSLQVTNSGTAGMSGKKIILPIGKISSNITISKTTLNSRNISIEEPSPSISLIDKRNVNQNSSLTSFKSTKKSILLPKLSGMNNTCPENSNIVNKEKGLHIISKLNKTNEDNICPNLRISTNNEENVTIITQFLPESRIVERKKSDIIKNIQTSEFVPSKIIETVAIYSEKSNEILNNSSLLQIQKNISLSTNNSLKSNNLSICISKNFENMILKEGFESIIGESGKLELKKEAELLNDERDQQKITISAHNAKQKKSDEFGSQLQMTSPKFSKTLAKTRLVKQQSLLKNKNMEILKRSPRTMGRSKSLSYPVSNKSKQKRRLSTSSDNNYKKLDIKNSISNIFSENFLKKMKINEKQENHNNSKKIVTNIQISEQCSAILDQNLLCEEKIETSPNISKENKLQTAITLCENLNFQHIVKETDQSTTSEFNKDNNSDKNIDIGFRNSPIFIEEIISNIKPNTPVQNAIQINELANILKWRTGIGLTKDAAMAFRINELGLLEIFEKNVTRNRLDIAYEKPIYQREKHSNKLENNSEPFYFCKGCNCHGPALDFLAPEYCSHDCITHYEKKNSNMGKSASLSQIYINQQRQKKLRKQKMAALLNDSSISIINNNSNPKNEFTWITYLSASKTQPAPIDLFLNPFPCGPNLFQVGMKLETIDPEYSSLFCVCSVVEIKGYRLKIHFDGYSCAYDFWINADSMDIFPPGWCAKTNRALQSPKNIHPSNFNWSTYLMKTKSIPAPRNLFTHLNSSSNTNPFTVGVRFEADDLRNTRKVCVASVADVLDNRILVHFDGWDDKYDYWVDCNSPYIHPVNWHLQNNFGLVPPPDWKDIFDWDNYLFSIKGVPATDNYFQTREPISFKTGMKLEIVDKKNPSLIRPGTVIMTDGYEVKVLFDGWSLEYAFWVVDDSPDIHPIGWCDATGHELESPPDFESLPPIMPCPVPGCRGIGNAKRYDIDFHAIEDSCPYLIANWQKELEKPERISYIEINKKEYLSSLKRKSNDIYNFEVPLKCNKTENRDNSSNNLLSKHTKDLIKSPFEHIKKFSSQKEHETHITNISPEMKLCNIINDVDEKVLDRKIQITKHLLCDYGPRLEQNYKLWLSYAKNITDKLERIQKNPLQWNVEDVVKFITKIPYCHDISKLFYKEDIDGEALLSLRQKDLTDILKIKLGTAIKIYNLIILLRAEVIGRFS